MHWSSLRRRLRQPVPAEPVAAERLPIERVAELFEALKGYVSTV
jgi:hypothetical protein